MVYEREQSTFAADLWRWDERDGSLLGLRAEAERAALSSTHVLSRADGFPLVQDVSNGTAIFAPPFEAGVATLSESQVIWSEDASGTRLRRFADGVETTAPVRGTTALAASGDLVAALVEAGPGQQSLQAFDRSMRWLRTLANDAFESIDFDAGNIVVGVGSGCGSLRVYAADGALVGTLNDAAPRGSPRISGEWVTWAANVRDGSRVALWRWTTGEVFLRVDDPMPAAPTFQLDPDIDGNRIVFVEDRDGTGSNLYAFDFFPGPSSR